MVSILHIITGLSTGGAESALYRFLASDIAKQYEHTVVSLTQEGPYAKHIRCLGVRVEVLGLGGLRSFLPGVRRLRMIVKGVSPDLIQGWMYHGNLAALLALRFSSVPVTVVWNIRHSLYDIAHEKILTRAVIILNRYLSNRASAIVFNSYISLQQHQQFGFVTSRSVYIPNGFDADSWPILGRGEVEKHQLFGISSDRLVVGHVARFHPMKNHALFLKSAVRVLESCQNISFVLIGRNVGLDSPGLSHIVPERLRHCFVCLGERDDVRDLMRGMDIFCLSSSWGEAFPNVLAEAMASGVPCVCTDVGDSKRIVNKYGLVVAPDDLDAMAKALLSMIELSNDERAQLGAKAREYINANYSIAKMSLHYRELYDELLDRELHP